MSTLLEMDPMRADTYSRLVTRKRRFEYALDFARSLTGEYEGEVQLLRSNTSLERTRER